MLVSRYAASVPPSGTGSAVVGAASGIGSASADESNHGVGLSAAGWALGHGTAVGCGRTPGHGTAAAHGRGLPAAGGHPAAGGRASAARPHGCGRAPGHGAGLSAASWAADSGTICHEPPFNRKNKHHAENENEPVHSDISPLLYSYRFYLLRNKYLALESTHL